MGIPVLVEACSGQFLGGALPSAETVDVRRCCAEKFLARRDVAWRRRLPAVVGVAKSASREGGMRCDVRSGDANETIERREYMAKRGRERKRERYILPWGNWGQGPARDRPQHYATPMFAMRHGRSLAHYESGDPLGQAARVHRESPKRLSEQRSRGEEGRQR